MRRGGRRRARSDDALASPLALPARARAQKRLDRFPEGARTVFVVNCPWYVASGYALFRPLLPARTQSKLRFFRDNDGDAMRRALDELVPIDQLPEWLGGGGAPGPWTAGDGGDVPVGLLGE